eukprot:5201144-Pyramimonas_sp.AAC.1
MEVEVAHEQHSGALRVRLSYFSLRSNPSHQRRRHRFVQTEVVNVVDHEHAILRSGAIGVGSPRLHLEALNIARHDH